MHYFVRKKKPFKLRKLSLIALHWKKNLECFFFWEKNLECFLTLKMGKMILALTIDLFFYWDHALHFICIPMNETDVVVDAFNGTVITYGQVRYHNVSPFDISFLLLLVELTHIHTYIHTYLLNCYFTVYPFWLQY